MIGNIKIIMIVALILCINAITISQNMGEPFLVKSGDETIDCKPPYTAPQCIDYDGDGLQDLIIGTYKGEFRFYKNYGTKAKPIYKGFELIQANGAAAKVPNW